MPYYTDKQIQKILNTEGFSNTSTRTLALDLQLARSELKRMNDLFILINNLMPHDEDFEHQISSHADTLPIVYRELSEGMLRVQEVVSRVMLETLEPDLKDQDEPPLGKILCKFCREECDLETAHLHENQWVGDECCWDERLKATE